MIHQTWMFGGVHSREVYDLQTGEEICKVHTATPYDPEKDALERGLLIAAAPDLLEFARKVAEEANGVCGLSNNEAYTIESWQDTALRLIARIEGRE